MCVCSKTGWILQLLALLLVQLTRCSQEPSAQLVVRSDPPGPVYTAATWILFTCKAENISDPASLRYEWYGAHANGSLDLLSDEPILDSDRSATFWYLSTYTSEIQSIHCMFFNGTELVNSSSVFLNLTGVGVHLDEVFLASIENSTSIIVPDALEDPLTLFCQSASRDSCYSGGWRAPNDTYISSSSVPKQSCNITVESDFITTRLSLTPELSSGLYTCVIPDEANVSRTVYIGVYSDLYERVEPFRSTLQMAYQSDRNHLLLTCTTRHLPSLLAEWERERVQISSSRPDLLDIAEAQYSTSLSLDWNSDGVQSVRCLVYADWIYPEEYFFPDGDSAHGEFVIAPLGSSGIIGCAALDGVIIQWLDTYGQPLNFTQYPQLTVFGQAITITNATDAIHDLTFQCTGRDLSGEVLVWNHYTVVVSVPTDIVMVTLAGNTSTPAVAGDSYNVTCCYALMTESVSAPTLEWYQGMEIIEISSEFDITADEQCSTLTFTSVSEEHERGTYSCRAEWSPTLLLTGNTTSHIAEFELTVVVETTTTFETTTNSTGTMEPTTTSLPTISMIPDSAAKRPFSLVYVLVISLFFSTLLIHH